MKGTWIPCFNLPHEIISLPQNNQNLPSTEGTLVIIYWHLIIVLQHSNQLESFYIMITLFLNSLKNKHCIKAWGKTTIKKQQKKESWLKADDACEKYISHKRFFGKKFSNLKQNCFLPLAYNNTLLFLLSFFKIRKGRIQMALNSDSHLPKSFYYLLQWHSFKNDEKCFWLCLESSFRSQDI